MSAEVNALLSCYGQYSQDRDSCRKCPHRRYCRDAAACDEESLLEKTDFALIDYAEEFATPPVMPEPHTVQRGEYSRSDLLEVIAFMACMDPQTLELLDDKIGNPHISFAEQARKQRVTRQAIHKFIQKKCREVPELGPVIHQRQNKIRQGGTNSFMEEVWAIRKQTSGRKSRRPNAVSKSCGTLTSLRQNLDLSRLSICKGGGSCISG